MRKALLILLLILSLIFSGCGNKQTTVSPTPSPDINRENISFYLTTKDNLSPIFADTENDVAVFSLIYDSLVYLEKDMSITPQLAKSCTVSSDSTGISFVLRDDVFWHDGENFTAEDVKFTIDTIKNAGKACIYFDSVVAVSDVQITDDYNFTLVLNGPYARIVNLLDFPIIPSHIDVSGTPVGTGKFKFSDKLNGGGIVLSKNNLWPLGELPVEETLYIRMLGKTSDEFSLFKTGEIDALNVSAAQVSQLSLTNQAKLSQYVTPKYEFIGFNHNNVVFSDIAVRQAISLGINREEVVKTSYLGMGTPVNSPIIPTAYFYNKDADYCEFSPDKAIKLLYDSGWIDRNGDGVLEKDFDGTLYTLETTLIVNNDNAFRVSATEKIVNMLTSIGFKINTLSLDWDSYCDKINSLEYGIFIGGIEFLPSFDHSFFLSSWAIENGQNFMNYNSPDMDNAISKTHTAVSMEECKNSYLEFQYIFTRDLPVTGILFQHSGIIYQDDINGVEESSFSKPLVSVTRWRRNK